MENNNSNNNWKTTSSNNSENNWKSAGKNNGQNSGAYDNYNGRGETDRNNIDIGENIKNIIQDTLDSIDYGGLGANINRAVNDGINQVRKQIERGRNQYNNSQKKWNNNGPGMNQGQWTNQNTGNNQSQWTNQNQSYANQGQWQNSSYNGNTYNNYSGQQSRRSSSYRKTELYPSNIVTHYPAGRVSGILLQVFGGIGFAGSLVTSIVFGALFLGGVGAFTEIALEITLPLLLISTIMISRGGKIHKRVKRFYEYVRLFGGKRYCDIKMLEEKTGRTAKSIKKDLKKMIKKGMFPQACFDDEGKTLILDKEVYEEYTEMKKMHEEAEREAEREKENEKSPSEMTDQERLIQEGKLYMKQIKEANDAIPGEEISKKLERLELITGKIFEYVASHPEKVAETRKFMDYYMPTTLKLVYAYKEFDAQDIQGDTINNAKEEIEHSLDMVNQAFENLFDSLFQEEAMDISSDISVLKTMLKQEGLMGSDFRKEKVDE